MKLIFDFDGTLIDSKRRLYALFCDLAPNAGLTFDEYWQFKLSGKSNLKILEDIFFWDQSKVLGFHGDWMRLIEREDYLAMDTVLPGVIPFLTTLKRNTEIYLCTSRQCYDSAIRQLEVLGFEDIFANILVTRQENTKSELILREVVGLNKDDWMIGDMGKDIVEGRELGVRTCAVLTGFMSKESLELYKPDLILPSVTSFNV